MSSLKSFSSAPPPHPPPERNRGKFSSKNFHVKRNAQPNPSSGACNCGNFKCGRFDLKFKTCDFNKKKFLAIQHAYCMLGSGSAEKFFSPSLIYAKKQIFRYWMFLI